MRFTHCPVRGQEPDVLCPSCGSGEVYLIRIRREFTW
jgi:hypothetical protein